MNRPRRGVSEEDDLLDDPALDRFSADIDFFERKWGDFEEEHPLTPKRTRTARQKIEAYNEARSLRSNLSGETD